MVHPGGTVSGVDTCFFESVAVDGFGVMSWASSNKNPVGNVSEIELGGSTTEATPRKRSLGYQVVMQTSHTFSSRASSRN